MVYVEKISLIITVNSLYQMSMHAKSENDLVISEQIRYTHDEFFII